MTTDKTKLRTTDTMRAAVIRRFGGPEALKVELIPIPQPKLGEVLVRIRAASINPLDYKIRSGQLQLLTGKNFPRILGCDFAGEVVDTNSTETEFGVGTRVFGMLNGFKGGGYAEYASVPVEWLAHTPTVLTDQEAAAIPVAARTAWKALRNLLHKVQPQSVLINGASGGVGTFAVQLARIIGVHVTAVSSRDAFNLVEQLGAERLLDYKETDFIKSSDRYNLIFDVAGNRNFCKCAPILNPKGLYITTAPSFQGVLAFVFAQPFTGKKALILDLRPDGTDLTNIARMVTENNLRPIVGKIFPLSEVAAAHTYGETKHPRGKIILQI
ncbi:MAG: NAD(P)-dependent alcohol dehydrogenase [Nostoc sp.]|uniref:NAD(P)-dependent alcohol dehydrogenase n=1 Tax=unclassified Nostoc TaxID=2593658 RepID=UPI0025F2FF10|nr:NAD(P)-dependent alcohol dehydrogenase [Nostoc sp. NMS9]MBN3944695.1 NAD(P)-dependent alcohol dehydrogenase [Nostoc sp. NMS9]